MSDVPAPTKWWTRYPDVPSQATSSGRRGPRRRAHCRRGRCGPRCRRGRRRRARRRCGRLGCQSGTGANRCLNGRSCSRRRAQC
ncbi:MAG: hypothetical protein EXQ79_00935 [Acidimicrobiia bacterium]|nr:hypothetical protein [Acidimicrobiia bacterium]